MKQYHIAGLLALGLALALLTGCGGQVATATVTPLPTNTPNLPATATQQALSAARTAIAATQTVLAEVQQTVSAIQTAGAATLSALDIAATTLNQTATAWAASLAATQTALSAAMATLQAGHEQLATQQTALAEAARSTAAAQAATATHLAAPTATPSPLPAATVDIWQDVTLPTLSIRASLPPGFVLIESATAGAIFERPGSTGERAIIAFNTDPGDLPAEINRDDPVALLQAALDDPANVDLFEVLAPATVYPGLRYPAAQARVQMPDSGNIIAYLTLKLSTEDWLFFSLAGREEDVERWLPIIALSITTTGLDS